MRFPTDERHSTRATADSYTADVDQPCTETDLAAPSAAYSARRAADIADVLKAVAEPNRLRLLHAIGAAAGGQAGVQELAERVGLAQPAASRHLATLLHAGLVQRRKDGRRTFYFLHPSRQAALRSLLGLPLPPV